MKSVSFEYWYESFYGLNQQSALARHSKWAYADKKRQLTQGFVNDTLLQMQSTHKYYSACFPLHTCEMIVNFTVPHMNVDVDNLIASLKPILDALVKADVLIGDNINVISAVQVGWKKQGKKHGVQIILEW